VGRAIETRNDMIDFEVEPDFQEQIDWVEKFTAEEIEPLDHFISVRRKNNGDRLDRDDWNVINEHIQSLKEKVKSRGLWGFHLGPELGGPGLGQVKLSLLNEKLGRTVMGPTLFGCQAPDTGNMELIAHNGTEEQKKKYMAPGRGQVAPTGA
jgi:acyl-CoA dehydrogenase